MPEAERKRHNQTFRVRGPMREKLKAAAKANERSISEEVEARLENSFRQDELAGLREEIARLRQAVESK